MKRPFLILLSLFATGGFGAWLVRTPNTQREILLACAGWVLGFWVAAAIQSRRRAVAGREDAVDDEWEEAHGEADLDGEDEAGWEDEEDWEHD